MLRFVFLPTLFWASLATAQLIENSMVGELHVERRTTPPARVRLGNEQLKEIVPLLGSGGVAVVANATSVLMADVRHQPVHLVDTLLSLGVQVKKVFAPEHGFRGDEPNGAHIADDVDDRTGLPLISLHGDRKKPRPEDLADVRTIVFDIQDVGARFYTYLSTLALMMEAASELGIAVMVCDRPNPHGHHLAGPMLQPEFTSFVGQIPVPLVHGFTLGEAASFINMEVLDEPCALTVIPCLGWSHSDRWDPPIAPSPNLPTAESIALYPSLCLFEPTVVSVGRGTERPFEQIGSPSLPSTGHAFTPWPIAGVAPHPKHEGQTCHGSDLHELGKEWLASPSSFDLWHIIEMHRAMPPQADWVTSPDFMDKLAGTDSFRMSLSASDDELVRLFGEWTASLRAFEATWRTHLAYPLQR
jgi:uncharacterized protein YbbC (DUF1343 family)